MQEKPSQLFRVPAELADESIVTALRRWLPGKSWSDVRNLLGSRRVTVSGNLCLDAGRRLKADEVVKVLTHPVAAPPRDDDVRITFIDAHIVVVEKPAGMTTLRHSEERTWPGRRKQLQPTLDEVLPRIIEKKQRGGKKQTTAGRKGTPRRVRAVHRLDRETSGLMLFARTADAERQLGLQFRAHSLHRAYVAVVVGKIEARTIETRLVEDRGDGRRGSTRDAAGGKVAVTHIKPLQDLYGYTLVECRLETGRTHQIRIHLAEAGHPLCGDKVYRGPFPGRPIPDASDAPRVALHAAELGFEHPITSEPMQFKMPLPADLKAFIERLRKKRPLGTSNP